MADERDAQVEIDEIIGERNVQWRDLVKEDLRERGLGYGLGYLVGVGLVGAAIVRVAESWQQGMLALAAAAVIGLVAGAVVISISALLRRLARRS